jgi:integrase
MCTEKSDMARQMNKLSARMVATVSEPGLYGDGGGLWLQVTDAGEGQVTKQWIARYMLNWRARKMGLGSVSTFSLAEARERARQVRQQLADGIDPIEARLAERDARRKTEAERITFKAAAERFLNAHESGWRNAKHRAQWRSTLQQYAYASLGPRPVSAIDAALINHTVAPIWTTTPETASRVKQRIERIVQWVKDGMPLPKAGAAKRVKHHSAMAYADLPAFMVNLRSNDSVSAKALEFTILTAARTGESIGAKWSEIDVDGKVWTVPAERMKGGRAHRVPLSDRAVAVLKSLPHEKGNPHVFVGGREGAGLSNMAMLELLKGMDGNGFTVHGFRSAFRDWAAERTNFPREVAEAALAHVLKDKVEAAYRRGDLFEKRAKLMDAWAGFLDKPEAGTLLKFRGGNEEA